MNWLDEKINDFIRLKNQIEELTKQKDELGDTIKNFLRNEPECKRETNIAKAKIITKTTYKYTDETAIINYLSRKGLSDIYMVRKIDTTKLNKELKNKGELYENLKTSIIENITESLTVEVL